VDHIPARSLFQGKQWPEGYVFPACAACNSGASDDELLMGVAVRILVGRAPTAEEQRELENALSGVRHRMPNVLRAFRERSRVETRRFFRENGVDQRSLAPDELYLMEIPREIQEAEARYGAKLGKALHYMHTRRIAPADAAVKVKVFTNVDLIKPNFPVETLRILTNGAVIQRGDTSLHERFTYRFAVTDTGEASAFWIVFGESTAMLVGVFSDGQRYEQRRADRLAKAANPEIADGLRDFA
jgi:hypothetical protein